MAEFLKKILASTREDLEVRKHSRPLEEVRDAAAESPSVDRSLINAIKRPGMSLIAEIKRASPSKGDIRPGLDVAAIAAAYEQAGAAAISVLTEERYFHGSLDDLRTTRHACGLPLLRKDFIIDAYQIWEARAAGADAILLIVAALTPAELQDLLAEAGSAGVDALVEVHNLEELKFALSAPVTGDRAALGINNRDLKSFDVDLETTVNLIKSVPEGIPVVSESGITSSEDVARLAAAGVDAVLVGETLMRSKDPGSMLRQLLSF
ncbi:MAG: indole-3-glycerol phosphate synthase TrpC [Thermoleophilia bacterium]